MGGISEAEDLSRQALAVERTELGNYERNLISWTHAKLDLPAFYGGLAEVWQILDAAILIEVGWSEALAGDLVQAGGGRR